jgi:hypothetical protein
LTRRQVHLDGTVDASAIYLHRVTVNASNRDVFFVTTGYGKTIALDADNGRSLGRDHTAYVAYGDYRQAGATLPY